MGSPRRIVLLGPPGSGKGTVASQLESKYGLRHLSSGQWLRTQIDTGSDEGRRVEELLKQGAFAPDELMIEILPDLLSAGGWSQGTILDGFPRNVTQAKALDELTRLSGYAVDAALLLKLADSQVVERIAGRQTCPKCGAVYHTVTRPSVRAGYCDFCGTGLVVRSDDQPQTVLKRLETYRRETEPVSEFYRKQGKLLELESVGGSDRVAERAALLLGL